MAVLTTPADSTDGVDIETKGLGGDFARGLLVMMNSRDRNFQLYSWDDVAKGISH